jgi:peptide/nickel transport system substrate-binding protein
VGKMKKYFLTLLFVFVMVMSLASIAGAEEDILVVAKDQAVVGFDPHLVPAASSIQVYQHIYNGLVDTDGEGNIISELAESWEMIDNTTYQFNLRKNVKFHNGRKMTAEDVKYSFERILDPDTSSIAQSYFSMVKEIKTPDDYTVVFELESPFAGFLTNVAHVWAAVVPKEVVEENGDLRQIAYGTGPFKLEEWTPDEQSVLVKNEDYFEDDLPKVDKIQFLVMKDESARIAALRSGQVHISSITSDAAEILNNQSNLEIINYPSLNYTYAGFNTSKEPFNDPKVRLALSYVIDRQQIAEIVYNGQATVTGPVPPPQKVWALELDEYPSYGGSQIEKAKELLSEAGYGENELNFTIKTSSSYGYMVDTALAIQSQLSNAGISTNIELVEWGTYIDAWSNTDHQILVGLNGSGTTPDRALHFFFHTEGTANVWGFSNQKFDEIVEKARVTLDQEERYELYAAAQKLIVNQEAPNLFLNAPYQFYAVNENVEGFTPTALTGESVIKNVNIK